MIRFKLKLIIIIVVAMIGAAVGFVQLSNTFLFLIKGKRTEGRVIDYKISTGKEGQLLYCPIIGFYSNNQLYHYNFDICDPQDSKMNIGDKFKLIYYKNNPAKVEVDDSFTLWFLPISFTVIPIIMLCLIFYYTRLIFYPMPPKHNREKIKSNSKLLETQFTSINEESKFNFLGIYPYRIYTQYYDRDENSVIVFKSNRIWFNPERYIKPGQSIKVYVNINNSKKYYVDLTFLFQIKQNADLARKIKLK